jgi:capsular polysaccharide biosynthesis protein
VAVRTHDNFLLHDSYHHPKLIHRSGLHRPTLPPIDLYLPGSHIQMGLLWGTAHYHWILDVLPRLAIVEKFAALAELPLILPQAITAVQRESLYMLGIRADRQINFHGNHWQVERLYYPRPLALPATQLIR